MKKQIVIALITAGAFLTGEAFAGQWVYRPMRINAKKGDIVLSAQQGMIEDVIKVVSGFWEHVGMVVDNGYTIRHNTRYDKDIAYDYYKILGLKVLPYRLNPDSLANGTPGIISEDINKAFYGEKARFFVTNGIVVKPRAANEARWRPALERAAEKMKGLDAYYRIAAYGNMFQQDNSPTRVKGRGSMCSSSVWFANYYAGNRMNYSQFSPEVSLDVAEVIYQSVIDQADNAYGIFGKILYFLQDLIGTGTNVKIANQVVNAFGHDRPADQSDYWRSHPVTAVTVSPDGLLLSTFANPSGRHGGAQTEGHSPYESVEPVTVYNGYWYYTE